MYSWDNASMTINLSESNATRRLLQCLDWGLDMNDVSRKFADARSIGIDLDAAEFMERRRVLMHVQSWSRENLRTREIVPNNRWIPILYNFEVS